MVDGDNSKPNLGRVIDYFDESARDLRIYDLKDNLILLFVKSKEGRAAVSGREIASS